MAERTMIADHECNAAGHSEIGARPTMPNRGGRSVT